jgi:hypothetical protein
MLKIVRCDAITFSLGINRSAYSIARDITDIKFDVDIASGQQHYQ